MSYLAFLSSFPCLLNRLLGELFGFPETRWDRVLKDGWQVHELGTRGIRSLAIARQDNEDGQWKFLGIMTVLDPPRPDTKDTIAKAKLFGVEVRAVCGVHSRVPPRAGGLPACRLCAGWDHHSPGSFAKP